MSKRQLIAAALIASAIAPIFAQSVPRAGNSQTVRIEQLAWLQGCWQLTSPQRIVEEQWMTPRAGTMLGMGRTTRDGKLVEYESVLIREQHGRLAYEAHPSGRPTAACVATTVTDTSVVFESAQHDFPQKVGYTRSGDTLAAWIEGAMGGQVRGIDFPYRSAPCPK